MTYGSPEEGSVSSGPNEMPTTLQTAVNRSLPSFLSRSKYRLYSCQGVVSRPWDLEEDEEVSEVIDCAHQCGGHCAPRARLDGVDGIADRPGGENFLSLFDDDAPPFNGCDKLACRNKEKKKKM